jgi:hypothetical protein
MFVRGASRLPDTVESFDVVVTSVIGDGSETAEGWLI